MKIIILGQPRCGKSTLAKKVSKKLNIPIICTDKYRRDWGFHEPWKGYETEISLDKQNDFYKKIKELYDSYDSVILEGSAIYPTDIDIFKYDKAVLLYKDITAEELLKLSRKYDKDWPSRRDDDYLLELFSNYISYSKKWALLRPELVYETTNYKKGIKSAYKYIIKK